MQPGYPAGALGEHDRMPDILHIPTSGRGRSDAVAGLRLAGRVIEYLDVVFRLVPVPLGLPATARDGVARVEA